MADNGGYWYKNETLLDLLNLTLDEQSQLKTILSTEIKYERRREKGLTKKQQELQDLKVEILKLKGKGLSNRKVARILNISESKVRTTVKK